MCTVDEGDLAQPTILDTNDINTLGIRSGARFPATTVSLYGALY